MLAMMQKYAGTLESLVDERTAQLAQEKRTTEALLLRMLPKCVCLLLLFTAKLGPDDVLHLLPVMTSYVGRIMTRTDLMMLSLL